MRQAARKRKTRQLEEVFKALQGDDTHPFAHEIYRRVPCFCGGLAGWT